MKYLIFLYLLALGFESVAEDSFSCIPANDFKEISAHFEQFKELIKEEKSEYCIDDFGQNSARWYRIVRSINYLKNITPNEPEYDAQNALTYKAINENSWWSYFVNRAHLINLTEECTRPGTAAYVYINQKGIINICLPFLKDEVPYQAGTLLHEVKHFDGQNHVTCTQGEKKGEERRCDNSILDQNAYAVSVQAFVAFARSEDTSEELKTYLESQAIYAGHNRFNEVPHLKIDNHIILSSQSGAIIDWNLNTDASVLVKKYESGVNILTSSSKITAYPVNPNLPAFRTDFLFNTNYDAIGKFAEFYNELPIDKRRYFSSVIYTKPGTFIYENTLYTLCDQKNLRSDDLKSIGENSKLTELNLSGENESLILLSDGTLKKIECDDYNNSDAFSIDLIEEKIDKSLMDSLKTTFASGGVNFTITKNGLLASLKVIDSVIILDEVLSLPDHKDLKWISAATYERARIFND